MKKIKFLLLIISISLSFSLFGQKVDLVFRNKLDSSKNYYYAVYPEKEIKAWMVILPGYGETPQNVFEESSIADSVIANGILLIVPSLKDWDTFYLDSASQNILSSLIIEVSKKYKLQDKPFIIGGFSLGASGAVKYAERALKESSNLPKTAMLFGIDPPLDLEKMAITFEKAIARNTSEITVNEAKFIKDKMKILFGNSKIEIQKASAYIYSDNSNSLIKSLVNIPVRLYTEPDIIWQMENRGRDFYDMNSADCSAMINDLRILGNKKAELIVTSGKGYRKNGNRNPHSYSIVDTKEFMNWINKNSSK